MLVKRRQIYYFWPLGSRSDPDVKESVIAPARSGIALDQPLRNCLVAVHIFSYLAGLRRARIRTQLRRNPKQ